MVDDEVYLIVGVLCRTVKGKIKEAFDQIA